MSAEEESRVWWSRLVRDADGITGPAKAVCWFLADVADKNGASWYSQEQIALKAGVTDRTVRNALDKLVGMGVVRVDAPTRQRSTQTVTLIASGLAGWKEIPVGAERDSTQPGKRFHPDRKDVPVGAERGSDKAPKKSPEEDPIEDPNEEHTVDDEPPNESDPTMHQTIADDIRRRHNSATDPAFVAALDHVVTRWAGTLAKLAEGPTGAHNVGASYLGSRPTMDADPIDNDGATTPPSVPAVSSPDRFDDIIDAWHRSEIPGPLHEALGMTHAQYRSWVESPAAYRAASTLSPAPATSDLSASIATEGGLLPLAFDAPPPAKPKRKAKEKTETDAQRRKRERAEQAAAEAETMLAAWGQCCQSYDTISGKVRRWDPAKGDGRLIAETMAREGQTRIVARFAQAARDPWCLDKRPDLAALCRGSTPFVSRLDAAAEQATLDAEGRSGEPQAVGGVVGRSESQNAPERQAAPKQNGSSAWDDMLTIIRSTGGLRLSLGLRGSTLSHDAGEHKRRCQAVADIGGWAKLCEMGEHNRGIIRAQFVAAYDRAGVSA